jgi:hypothetical protein
VLALNISTLDLDVPCCTTLEACAAARIEPSRLKSWFNREPPIILLRKNERFERGKYHGRLLTIRRVFQIALTAELMRHDITAQRAGNLAAIFTDQAGEKPTNRRGTSNDARRRPGHLFPSGGTILLANRDGKFAPVIAAVVNALLAEVVERYKSDAVVVDVEEVVNRVLACLPLMVQCPLPMTELASLHCPRGELGLPALS